MRHWFYCKRRRTALWTVLESAPGCFIAFAAYHLLVGPGLNRADSCAQPQPRRLLSLVTRVAHDLRSGGLAARTITVKLRDNDFRTRSARRTLPAPVVADRVIIAVAKELLAKLRTSRRVPARLIGVALSSLAEDVDADQLTLFERQDPLAETDKDRALARSVDRVREKFGRAAIGPASIAMD